MSQPGHATSGDCPPRSHLRLVAPPKPVVVDVALFYGERSGGIRTYLDAKVAWARKSGQVDHHLVVPGEVESHADGIHRLPSVRLAASNGYRIPLGARALKRTLNELQPDAVVLHDPFWRPLGVARLARTLGAVTVAAHHGSSDLSAGAFPGPHTLWRTGFRAWVKHAYAELDMVLSAGDWEGRAADRPLRFGLDPAFRPPRGIRRQDHVLYAGRLAREKGIGTLLEAAAKSDEPWPLHIVGTGSAGDWVESLVSRLKLTHRVKFLPFVADKRELARTYASARCVVMPGAWETFGLVGYEAAASGAAVVACETAPSARMLGPLVNRFAAHDPDDLLRAIGVARARTPDRAAAHALADRSSWDAVFDAELHDILG